MFLEDLRTPESESNITDHQPSYCSVVVDKDDNGELVCDEPTVITVLVRNAFGLFEVALCAHHRRMHNTFYNSKRVRNAS